MNFSRMLRLTTYLFVLGAAPPAFGAGDLTGQTPIEVRVDLGTKGGDLKFVPDKITFETGKLYKLVLHNPSDKPHYFTSLGLASKVFTRKVVAVTEPGGAGKATGEIKGAIREIEVFPGGTVEWWFVPVATGTINDLNCSVKDPDGRTHADKGMVGGIIIQ